MPRYFQPQTTGNQHDNDANDARIAAVASHSHVETQQRS
jgi:hypothetical protein